MKKKERQHQIYLNEAITEQKLIKQERQDRHREIFSNLNLKRLEYENQLNNSAPEFKERLINSINECVKKLDNEIDLFFRYELEQTEEIKDYFQKRGKGSIDFRETTVLSNKKDMQYSKNDIDIESERIIASNINPKLPGIVIIREQLPDDIEWKNISITVVDENTIKILYPNGSLDLRFSQTEEFINKTTKKTNTPWQILKELSIHGSFLPRRRHHYEYFDKTPGLPKDRIYELSKALKSLFGITENPFKKYNPRDGWNPKFQINDDRIGQFDGDAAAIRHIQEQRKKSNKPRRKSTPEIGNTYSSDTDDNK